MSSANITAALNWNGTDYVLKYRFSLIRELRAEGLDLPRTCRLIRQDPARAVDYADEVAEIAAYLLRDAGAEASGEDVFRECMGDVARVRQLYALFNWVCGQHFATSEVAPLPKKAGKSSGGRKTSP